MSCNGCRILRKGCNQDCILRQSLQGIQSPQAQANATVFVAKFFGRAGLMSFLSSVHQSQRPDLFQSLLFEACGRTVNPVNGAVGLQCTGNWWACQAAVETVLRGCVPRVLPELEEGVAIDENDDLYGSREIKSKVRRQGFDIEETTMSGQNLPARMKRRRENRPLMRSHETTLEGGFISQNDNYDGHETKLLRLFF